MKKQLIMFSTMAAATMATVSQAYATTSYISGSLRVTRIGSGGVASISTLISAMFNISIIVALIFVFFMLILGGYGWLTAGGDKAKVEEARTRITNALIGMAIVASAWALITIVGQFFGFSLTNLRLPTATGTLTGTGGDTGGL